MQRGEASGEEGEVLWEKLRRVGKRGGNSTPSASFWRTNELGVPANFGMISSRKLAAALWELHHCKLPLDNMRRGVGVPPPPPPPPRRRNRRADDEDVGPPPPTSFHLPESSRNLRSLIDESPMQHLRSIEKNNPATNTVSPSSCSSSMEIAPCNPATPSTSIELKGRKGELTNSLRAPTELLKVLNCVWSLEEQRVSNMSLIKALNEELDRAHFHAKELAKEQQGGRHEMDELMKHITGGKLLRKNKEQERIKAKVQSIRDELGNERKLRKHVESLQRKLGQELYEVKSSLANISQELEKERISRALLEDLCDELAWGLIDYEKELHDQRHKSGEDLGGRDDHDQLILRISQAWLDERMRVKQQHGGNVGEKNPTTHKLSSQIEGFLQNERNGEVMINGNQMLRNPMFRRSSLESIPLNLGASAHREEDNDNDDDDDDNGSSSSHSNCFEVEKTSESTLKSQRQKIQENHFEEMLKQEELKEKLKSSDWTRALSPSRLQAKFEEHMARAMSYGISQKAENFEAAKDIISEDKHKYEGMSELDSSYAIDNIIRNYYAFSENGMQSNKDHVMASSLGRSFQSPLCEWTENLPAQDLDTSETPSEFPPELKESTLRAKLCEARSGGQKSRSHQRASIYHSEDE